MIISSYDSDEAKALFDFLSTLRRLDILKYKVEVEKLGLSSDKKLLVFIPKEIFIWDSKSKKARRIIQD